ncbi:SUMO-activating enzyme (SAE) [Phytophthora cinnamomi]|uniref:SUMO-activating enzyme (SAE) n=1 Tax=Phytophthora cinnamomi TaxID=4785 RepID=UPI003559FC2C|nr:SUMO-activating enzyme (SAE) [Phytophthora cinnamomi]
MAAEQQATATFSAAEAAVYDRQMRLWGVEAQQRLQRSRVLVSGLCALGSELVKNLVLAGVGVTLHDARPATACASSSQFFLSAADAGANRAEACLPRARELNPLVQVASETRPLDALPDAFFAPFSAVCLVGADRRAELRLDALCHAAGAAFFAARSFGFAGLVFADLGAHAFRRSAAGADAAPSEPERVQFPTLEQAQKVPWSSLQSARKRAPQLPQVFVKNQLLQGYKSQKGVEQIADSHAVDFIQYAREQFAANGLDEDYMTPDELQALVRVADTELAPICAVVAGILGQEVIKAISQKDEPICNYFCFDGVTGTVRRIG